MIQAIDATQLEVLKNAINELFAPTEEIKLIEASIEPETEDEPLDEPLTPTDSEPTLTEIAEDLIDDTFLDYDQSGEIGYQEIPDNIPSEKFIVDFNNFSVERLRIMCSANNISTMLNGKKLTKRAMVAALRDAA